MKFYREPDGSVSFVSPFYNGSAKDLVAALNLIASKQQDILYDINWYDDVLGVEIGSFELAEKPIKRKGKEYLGKLIFNVELTEWEGLNTLKKAVKNPEALEEHKKIVRMMRRDDARKAVMAKLKEFGTKLLSKFRGI